MSLIPAFLRKAFSFAKTQEDVAPAYPERVKISLAFLGRTVSHTEKNTDVESNVEICARGWKKIAKIFQDLSEKPGAGPQTYQLPIHLNVIAAGIQVTHSEGVCMIPSKSLLYIYDNMDFIRKVGTDFAAKNNPDPSRVVSLFGAADARNPFAQNAQKASDIENFAMKFVTMMEKAVLPAVGREPHRAPINRAERSKRHFGNPG